MASTVYLTTSENEDGYTSCIHGAYSTLPKAMEMAVALAKFEVARLGHTDREISIGTKHVIVFKPSGKHSKSVDGKEVEHFYYIQKETIR